jgi:hypothetical protein
VLGVVDELTRASAARDADAFAACFAPKAPRPADPGQRLGQPCAGAVDQSAVSMLKPSLPNVVQGDEQINCWRG